MKWKINMKGRKKEKNKKNWFPQDSNLGGVAVEVGRLATGLDRGVRFCGVINYIYHVKGPLFLPRSNKAVSPDRPQNRHHSHLVASASTAASSATSTTLLSSSRRSRRRCEDGEEGEEDQEPRAVTSRDEPEPGPSDREVHPGSRRCGGARALRLHRRRGGKGP